MREVMEKVNVWLWRYFHCDNDHDELRVINHNLYNCLQDVKECLSVQPRNCDRFSTFPSLEDAAKTFLKEELIPAKRTDDCELPMEKWEKKWLIEFADWLLSPKTQYSKD